MPELRKDPFVGRWVIIATERARRPGNFIGSEDNHVEEIDCFFCAGHEEKTPSEIYAIRDGEPTSNKPDWQVRVIPNKNPILRIEGDLNRRGHGLYDVMNGIGAHEVVIETPEHIANMADLSEEQITLVIKVYCTRINDLAKDKRFKYVLASKNYGISAGAQPIQHSRSQIIATPVNPLRVKEKLSGARKYFEYRDRCLYCDLIAQELSDGRRIVAQSEHFLCVIPFAPRFPFEVWILPKKHNCNFAKGVSGYEGSLAKILKEVLLRLKIGLNDPAYNYVIHSAPFRQKSTRAQYKTIEEGYHWHIEVIPRLTYIAGFEKGTGFYICPTPPEQTAEFLRETEIQICQS